MPRPSSEEQEAALAEALRESQPGDVITVHAVDCASLPEQDDSRCNCTPLVIVVKGASA